MYTYNRRFGRAGGAGLPYLPYRLVPLSLQLRERLFHVTEQFLFLRYLYILFDVSFSVMMTIGN